MKIRFNWGTGIFIAIIIMISGMLTLVYIATRQDFYLVDKDYYQKGLDYQTQIDRINNVNRLDEKPILSFENDVLSIQFPKFFSGQNLKGHIHIYSPLNEAYDQNDDLMLDNYLQQFINMSNLKNGRYTVKLEWTANDTEYYMEQNITNQ